MLVLARCKNESVYCSCACGRVVKVTVAEHNEKRVKLGFESPPDVLVHREEVLQRIEREKLMGGDKRLRLDGPHLNQPEQVSEQ